MDYLPAPLPHSPGQQKISKLIDLVDGWGGACMETAMKYG